MKKMLGFVERMLWYQSAKLVQIQSWKIGLLHYLIMLIVLGYVIGYQIVWEKGYQATGEVVGSASIKVKGVGYANDSAIDPPFQVWDAYDVVQPPTELNAAFITTSYHITVGQTRGVCEGNDNVTEACDALPSGCYPQYTPTLNGLSTGVCGPNGQFCEIYGWCPPETNNWTANINGIDAFTLFMKTSVRFPDFDIARNNANGTVPTNGYNIWNVTTMVSNSGNNLSQIITQGAVIMVNNQWECNFDYSASKCVPQTIFTRIDSTTQLSPGYNYRYTRNYYLLNETTGAYVEHRDLIKVYGVRFVFIITGEAGKFSLIPTLVAIGSGVGLLTIATVITDAIAFYILPQKKRFAHYQSYRIDSVPSKAGIRSEDGSLAAPINNEISNYEQVA